MSMQAVALANRSGSEKKSTEPETEEKKPSASRYNAVKHGLTAKTPVLPHEDEAAYLDKVAAYKESLQTRTPLEDELAELAAKASWQLARASRSGVARAIRDRLTLPAAAAFHEARAAAALAQRLFHDRRGPIDLYPSRNYIDRDPRTSHSEDALDPDDPALLVLELETTLAGCRLLLRHWGELRILIESGLGWQSHEKMRALRLLGRQPLNALSVSEVTEVFLACHVMAPQHEYAFQELRCEIHDERFKRHKALLEKRDLAAITPADATAARAVLLGIVDKATERLRMLEADHQEVAEIVEVLQPDILAFDDSKSGEQIRRLTENCNRLLHRNIDAVHKARRDEASGWGRTRQQRERRNEERASQGGTMHAEGGIVPNRGDLRLVVDGQGTVRGAYGYAGNLEEGLARYEAEFGRQPVGTTDSPREIDTNDIPRVPDYARWIKEEKRKADLEEWRKAEGVRLNESIEAAPGFGDGVGDKGVERGEVAAMELTVEGDRAKNQNEIVDVRWAIKEGAEETSGQADDGVRDPRRTEEEETEETYGRADDGVGDPRRTETFGRADDGDPPGARDPRRTETFGRADDGDPPGARDPRRTEGQVIDAEPGFGNGAEGVEHDEVVAMGLAAEGDRAKNQNEIVEEGRVDLEGRSGLKIEGARLNQGIEPDVPNEFREIEQNDAAAACRGPT